MHGQSNRSQDSAVPSRQPMFVLQDRYEVINYIGQGGMGTVYIAEDRRLGRRPCVVKKLRDDFFREEDKEKAMSFFEREALVLSKLRHENIVHILDSFKEENDCYLVMEYVEGENLYQMLSTRGEPFPEESVMKWAAQIADVLTYLHTNDPPVIYRDLKPSNVMIDFTKDRVKLVDFGIARPYVDDSDNTHVVSAGYSPPEQYWGAAVPRSDIYALGATMYFLLTGQEPLALQTSSPRNTNPEVTEYVDRIVRQATEQDIMMRYESAEEMKEDIERWRELRQSRSTTRKNKVLVVVAAVAAILVVVISYALWRSVDKESEAERTAEKSQLEAERERAKIRADRRDIDEKLKQLEEQKKAIASQVSSGDEKAHQKTDSAVSSKPQYKPASVSFVELDEDRVTDPEGMQSPGSQ